jgi:hypothetical protein
MAIRFSEEEIAMGMVASSVRIKLGGPVKWSAWALPRAEILFVSADGKGKRLSQTIPIGSL